jgi:hypothetical protein
MARLDKGGWLTLHFGLTGALQFLRKVQTVELFQSPPPGATGYQILASLELGKQEAAATDVPIGGSFIAD